MDLVFAVVNLQLKHRQDLVFGVVNLQLKHRQDLSLGSSIYN